MRLITFLLLVLLHATAGAAPYDIVIIDAAHTQTGDTFENWLGALPEAKVSRLDIPQLRNHGPIESGVVVWLSPETNFVDRDIARQWDAIRRNENIGLMIVGLSDEADAVWLMDALRARVNAAAGERLGTHLEQAKWIWVGAKGQNELKVHLRQTFQL